MFGSQACALWCEFMPAITGGNSEESSRGTKISFSPEHLPDHNKQIHEKGASGFKKKISEFSMRLDTDFSLR